MAESDLPPPGTARKSARRRGPLLLELAVIFVGITASFWVEEWRGRRQDTETFHRILGEIYYDIRIDESGLTGWAASNNLALIHASDLVLQEIEDSPAAELHVRLERVFADFESRPTVGGYTRLTNTPLTVPVSDIQLSLDNLYGLYLGSYEALARRVAQLRAIRSSHWTSRGIVPCDLPLLSLNVTSERAEQLDLLDQVTPAEAAVHDGDACVTEAFNRAAAARALDDESFRSALRQAVAIRRDMALLLVNLRIYASDIRSHLEGYLPDISLPIETLGMVGSATTVEWEARDALLMRRLGPNDWVLDISLADGEVKFVANRAWTINWGAQRPWVARRGFMAFEEGQVHLEDAFPAGRAHFNGLNIPVTAGLYRVRFDSQSGDYRFERLGPQR